MSWVDDIINSVYVSLSQLWEIVKDRKAWVLQSVGLEGVGHS